MPRTKIEIGLEVFAAVGIIYGLYSLISYFPALPDSIPTHFNFKGEADSWGGKDTIWILGAVLVILYGSMTLLIRIPHHYNYPWKITRENAERQYSLARVFITLLKTEIVWLFVVLICETIKVALGDSAQLEPSSLFLYFALIAASIVGYILVSYRAR